MYIHTFVLLPNTGKRIFKIFSISFFLNKKLTELYYVLTKSISNAIKTTQLFILREFEINTFRKLCKT